MQQPSTGPPATAAAAASSDGLPACAETAVATLMTVPPLVAKVKLSQIINQSIDQDIPLLEEAVLMKFRHRYIEVCGDEPLPGSDATDAQLSALHFMVENSRAPYVDFAVWGPHGLRAERKLRFVQQVMDCSGKRRATEQHGPATIEIWRSCWEVFAVAAISIGIAHPAVLARYARRFEERVARYNRAWHICIKADERCRSEHWGAERRRQARFAEAHPVLTAMDTTMP